MRWILIGLGIVFVLIVGVLIVGFLTPREHVASVRASYPVEPERVFAQIADVAHGAEWRSGLMRVEVLSQPDEPARWRETAEWGTITFVHERVEAPRLVVSRIVDEGQGFGGTWTYAIEPLADGGSTLTITEHGVIYNPLYRFMSRYLMGYYASLEGYARDLGRRLRVDVEPQRLRR
jgi:hypothetical protein